MGHLKFDSLLEIVTWLEVNMCLKSDSDRNSYLVRGRGGTTI